MKYSNFRLKMASVGSGDVGKTLIGAGNGQGPIYASMGTNSSLTGVIVGHGNSAFTATDIGTTGQVLTSNGISGDPTFQTLASSGTWTPLASSDGTPPTVTYGVQRGIYVKVGNLCFVSGLMTFASYTGGSGSFQIGPLPFAASANLCFPMGSANLSNTAYAGTYTNCVVQDTGGPTYVQFGQNGPATSFGAIPVSTITVSTGIIFSVCYQTV